MSSTIKVLHDIVVPFVAIDQQHGCIWAGQSGIGKTPLSRILATAFSEYAIHQEGRADVEAGYRVGNHLDFFRGAPGHVCQPAVYDDGDVPNDSPAALKVFLDPAELEASFWARWGSCRFATKQSRQLCTNAFDESAEPDNQDLCAEVIYSVWD